MISFRLCMNSQYGLTLHTARFGKNSSFPMIKIATIGLCHLLQMLRRLFSLYTLGTRTYKQTNDKNHMDFYNKKLNLKNKQMS